MSSPPDSRNMHSESSSDSGSTIHSAIPVRYIARRNVESADSSFSCDFCHKSFTRKDTVRRHYRTCSARASRPIPSPSKRGRRRRACDSCVKSKSACDYQWPCKTCRATSLHCTYDRVSEDSGRTGIPSPPIQFPSPERPLIREVIRNAKIKSTGLGETLTLADVRYLMKTTVPFLLTFTRHIRTKGPSTLGFFCTPMRAGDQIRLGSPDQIPASAKNETIIQPSLHLLDNKKAHSVPPVNDLSLSLEPPELIWPALDLSSAFSLCGPSMDCVYPQFLNDTQFSAQGMISTPSLIDTSVDFMLERPLTLQARADELIADLQFLSLSLPNKHPQAAPNSNLDGVGELLSATNIPRLIDSFFDQFYYLCNILHRPTFDPLTVLSPLLLAVVLIGAVYSPDEKEQYLGRSLLDLSEEYIFFNPVFMQTASSIGLDEKSTEGSVIQLQAAQAALLILKVQTWEGSNSSRRRVIRTRFPEMIAAAESLALPRSRNPHSYLTPDQPHLFDWTVFIQNECRIRLCNYAMRLDTEYAVFHQIPPRLLISQLQQDLCVCEEAFSATTPSACFEILCRSRHSRPPSMARAINLFLGDAWNEKTQQELGELNLGNLFEIICGLHQALWISRKTFISSSSAPRIMKALFRWKSLWDKHVNRISVAEWSRIGFARTAIEFWWLARLILEIDSRGQEGVWKVFEGRAGQVLSEQEREHVAKLLCEVDRF